MRKLLSRIAILICPHLNVSTVRWHLLRYPDTLEIRRRLLETYAPATCRLAMSALRGVLRDAWRLGQLSREEFERAIDFPAVRGTHKRRHPLIDPHRIHNIYQARERRIRSLKEIIDEYLVGYRLRNRAPRFAIYTLGYVARLLGTGLAADIDTDAVLTYQEDRWLEGAAPKSINEEVRFLLKLLGDPGEIIRAQLREKM